MFFQKITSKKYVIDISATDIIDSIINKINKKRDRLIDKKQISENDFDKMDVEYSSINKDNLEDISKYMETWLQKKMLMKNRKKFIIATFNESPVNIKSWEILGLIEPMHGTNSEYNLTSYNQKDMPKKYRELEDPSNCEHCNTERKRNQTFVIRNNDTQEVLQVGSSCMTDFVSKDDLSFLLAYTKIMTDVKEGVSASVSKSVSLYNKNEILATMISMKEKNKSLNKSDILNIYNIEELEKDNPNGFMQGQVVTSIEDLKVFIPTAEHRDMADEIMDFYEELNVSKYSDKVFNVANIISADTDFILDKEIDKIINVLWIKDTIEQKSDNYKGLMADYNYGVEIGESDKITYDYKDLFYAAKLAEDKYGMIRPKENESLNTSTYIMLIINPERVDMLIGILDPSEIEEVSKDVKQLHKEWQESKVSGDVKEYYSELMEFAENVNNRDSSFVYTIKNIIKGADKTSESMEIESFNRKIIWSQKLLKGFSEKKIKDKVEQEKNEKGLTGKIFENAGDTFEKWEVKFKSIENRFSIQYGTEWKEYIFEDKAGNNLSWSTNNGSLTDDDDEGSEGWAYRHSNQWIDIKGKFKEYGKTYLNNGYEKIIKINYVSSTSALNTEPSSNGEITMLEKGKKFKIAGYKVDEIKQHIDNNTEYNQYILEDSDGEMSSILTQDKLSLEEGKFYKIGHMGEKIVRNVKEQYISEITEFERQAEYMTKSKLDKEFGVKSAKKPKISKLK
jgi:hypothetical protein